jgi:hypothetical protein
MKKIITLATIAGLGAASVNAQILTSAYNPATGHTYYLLQKSTWSVAESQAIVLGGHLATINDAAENEWVATTLSNFGGVQRGLWIGLTDQDHEGTFTWVSGDPSTYRNWEVGQPDNGGGSGAENWVNIWPKPGGRNPGTWNDYNGHDDNWFGAPFCGVVEVVPEPTALALMGLGTAMLLFRRRRQV